MVPRLGSGGRTGWGRSEGEDLVNAARQIGGVIGIALLGALVAHRAAFVAGLHVAVIIGGGAFLLGCGLTLAAVPEETDRVQA